jgi:hypothetical protein
MSVWGKKNARKGDYLPGVLKSVYKKCYGNGAYSSLPSLASSAAAFSCMAWMSGKAE